MSNHIAHKECREAQQDDLLPCPECGQIDHGQTGEHPCPECGLPWIWDDPEEDCDRTKVETMRGLLVYALAIMDEKGKSVPEKSRALWETDWQTLRLTLVGLVDMIDQIRDKEEE